MVTKNSSGQQQTLKAEDQDELKKALKLKKQQINVIKNTLTIFNQLYTDLVYELELDEEEEEMKVDDTEADAKKQHRKLMLSQIKEFFHNSGLMEHV